MSKEFYTEKDIEDLFQRGIRSLQINENVVLTELAYEKANRLGLQLVTEHAQPVPFDSAQVKAAPVAPAMPPPPPASTALPDGSLRSARAERQSDVEARIRSAVIAKLGDQVDATLLDNIIHRVVKSAGLK